MTGITIYTEDIREMASEAIARFIAHTGCPCLSYVIPASSDAFGATLELLAKIDVNDTCAFFDADLWFLRHCDLSGFHATRHFWAAQDPTVHDARMFPYKDAVKFSLDRTFYINSGFFVWTPKRWHKSFRRAHDFLNSDRYRKNTSDFSEQTALNMALQSSAALRGEVRLLPAAYNWFPFSVTQGIESHRNVDRPYNIHAAGYGRWNGGVSMSEKLAALRYYEFKLMSEAPKV